jgi:hypothetical protein
VLHGGIDWDLVGADAPPAGVCRALLVVALEDDAELTASSKAATA